MQALGAKNAAQGQTPTAQAMSPTAQDMSPTAGVFQGQAKDMPLGFLGSKAAGGDAYAEALAALAEEEARQQGKQPGATNTAASE